MMTRGRGTVLMAVSPDILCLNYLGKFYLTWSVEEKGNRQYSESSHTYKNKFYSKSA